MQHRLHLHALQHEHGSAGGDGVTHRGRRRDHQCRRRRAHHATLVPADVVGDPVDLDEVRRTVGRGDDLVPDPVDDQSTVELVDALDLDVDDLLVGALGHRDVEPVLSGLQRRHAVRRAAQLEVHRAADLVLHLRATTVGGLEQPGDLHLELVVVGLDRGGDQGHAGVRVGDQSSLAADPVDPPGVGPTALAGRDLWLVEQVEDEALVGRATLDHHGRVAHRAPQPGQRLVAVAAVGDDLRDHRVEVGGDGVALAHTGVHADAGSGRQLEQGDASGSRGEVAVGVLGVEPRLDRVTLLGRLLALQAAAGSDMELCLDQVEVGRDLGDRVLDLQAGVDLEEREHLGLRVVEELHRACALVVDGQGEPLGRCLELRGLLRGEQWRGGLLDHLLVAALDRAVADADRPRRTLSVGDDLDLDVPGARDQALEEDHPVAERALGLVAGALVDVLELFGRGSLPDAAPAAAGRGLEHHRVADSLRRVERVLERVEPSPAPRCDGDTDLLGDELRPDLVAELSHRRSAGTDEGHAQAVTQVDEEGVLGHEAPAHPHRVGLGLAKGTLQHREVEVGTRPTAGPSG